MIIKDPLTHESLVRDSRTLLPDNGCDHTQCHIDRLYAAARARTRKPTQPKVKPKKVSR